jgi:hypothetical protein
LNLLIEIATQTVLGKINEMQNFYERNLSLDRPAFNSELIIIDAIKAIASRVTSHVFGNEEKEAKESITTSRIYKILIRKDNNSIIICNLHLDQTTRSISNPKILIWDLKSQKSTTEGSSSTLQRKLRELEADPS